MKMCVLSVLLFKISASIIYNLRKRACRAPYFRQRFHLFTQYVLCRYGRYRFSERCWCTKICDFQQYHVQTSLKRMYGASHTLCQSRTEIVDSIKNPSNFSKTEKFFQKICYATWKFVLRPFRCSKSAFGLSTTWRKRHAVLHISDNDSIWLLHMCRADTVATVFLFFGALFLHKNFRFPLISRANAPETYVRGSPHVLCQSRTEIVGYIKKCLNFFKNGKVFRKICHEIWCSTFCLFRCSKTTLCLFDCKEKSKPCPMFSERDRIWSLDIRHMWFQFARVGFPKGRHKNVFSCLKCSRGSVLAWSAGMEGAVSRQLPRPD